MSSSKVIRSSVYMGGATALSFVAGLIRTKVVAMLLGPAGVGLVGIFTNFGGNLAAVSSWGIWTSGVRTISAAPEEEKARKSAAVGIFGRRLIWLGLALAVIACWPVTFATFADGQYLTDMLIVGLTAPLVVATGIWTARLQAYGHLRALAKGQVLSAILGLLLGVPLIWMLGAKGIAPSLLLAALLLALITWRSAARLCPFDTSVEAQDKDLRELAKLGTAFMAVAFMGQLAAYGTRLILVRQLGLEAAGHYQAAAAIAGSLIGLVVSAMGAGFFPQVAAAADESASRRLVDRQIEVGVMLGLPALVILVGAGGFCLHLLYAQTFDPALPVLTWMTWGILFRLLSWPMTYWLMARGSSKAVILAEGFSCACSVALPLFTVPYFGLAGAGIAFFLGHAIYAVALLAISRRRSGGWIGRPALRAMAWAVLFMACTQLLAPMSRLIVVAATLVSALVAWQVLRSAWVSSEAAEG
jgi:enterobacterial common antigen flippase